jgi:hypothetical protein
VNVLKEPRIAVLELIDQPVVDGIGVLDIKNFGIDGGQVTPYIRRRKKRSRVVVEIIHRAQRPNR